jgi:histidine ammonia-lyase
MPLHLIDNATVNCATFAAWARRTDGFGLAPAALARLAADRRVVEAHLASDTPVYGLNTGLGGNLAYRLQADEVLAFQTQLIRGRMIGMGEPLPEAVARAALLARVMGLARGGSGVSPAAAQALVALLDRGITPVVPMIGAIGAGDLGLCAHLVAPVIGMGEAWYRGKRLDGAAALAEAGLAPVALQAKDGLGLINASPLTAGYGALVACELTDALLLGAGIAALADEAYAANLSVFDPRIAQARPAGQQLAVAALFRALLAGSSLYEAAPRSVQDAVSFRTEAQVFGSAYAALGLLQQAVEAEINGVADSPLVLSEGDMLSSPNFHTSMVALAFDSMAIAVCHLSAASVQRLIKLQAPGLSGLPRYLSPAGGASVGFNALQKTAAALHAEIRLKAAPASLDAVVVSETVEDHASHSFLCVRKLAEQLQLYRQLLAIEALVAAQGVDLRQPGRLGKGSRILFAAVRAVVSPLEQDRPCGPDAMAVLSSLNEPSLCATLRQALAPALGSQFSFCY